MTVVLDANVIVSAFQFKGRPLEILQMGVEGKLDIAIAQPIIDETLRVLREKFAASTDDLAAASAIMNACGRLVRPIQELKIVKADPKDDHIAETAVAAGAEAIITGDKHLLNLREYEGIVMVKPADFLSRFRVR